MAIPHNLARRLSQDFCPNSKFGKWRNPLCISHFSNRRSEEKRRLRLAGTIVRCCLRKARESSLQAGMHARHGEMIPFSLFFDSAKRHTGAEISVCQHRKQNGRQQDHNSGGRHHLPLISAFSHVCHHCERKRLCISACEIHGIHKLIPRKAERQHRCCGNTRFAHR